MRVPERKERAVYVRVLMLGPGLGVRGGVSSVERLLLDHAEPPLEIRHLSTMEDGPALRKLAVAVRALVRLVACLLMWRPRLVHVHFSFGASTWRKLVLAVPVLLLGRRLVLHAHGSDYRTFYGGLGAPLRRVVTAFLRRAHGFIALSESWKEYYTRDCGVAAERVRVFANPVHFPDVAAVPRVSGPVTLVFAGRLGARKGTFDLLQAFGRLEPGVRERARLVLCGDGETAAAAALAGELGLGSRLEVKGWLTPREQAEVFAASDIFVLPSYDEGLPMALLEAMTWRLAVVTTPVGGIPEIVRDGQNGLLVSPGDVPGLAQAMQALIVDGGRRRALAEQAHASVQPLDIRRYMAELTTFYAAVGAAG